MRRIALLLGFAALLWHVAPLAAQSPKDSAHVGAVVPKLSVAKARADSVNRALAQCAATKNCAGYVKSAGLIQQRLIAMFPGLFGAESLLVKADAPAPVPPKPDTQPTPVPVPVDTAPTPVPVPIPTPTPVPVDTSHAVGDAELPRVFINTAVSNSPSNGGVIHVGIPDNLQLVFETANCGDKIMLAAGVTFTGNFVIRRECSAAAWITVQTENCATMPGEGVRVSPAAASCFATIQSTGVVGALLTGGANGAAKYWRFIGVRIANDASAGPVQGTVFLGSQGSDQSTLASMPSDLILDRVIIDVPAGLDNRRCVTVNGVRISVIESYIAGCKSVFDAQAITSTNGPGPYKIVDNYLESSGENIAFGGAYAWFGGNPSDVEIRGNWITKTANVLSGGWTVKNLVEFKAGVRVLIDGNVFEHSPNSSQSHSVVFWSANAGCSFCTTQDVTFRNNYLRDVYSGFSLSASYDASSTPMRNVTIRNNLIVGMADRFASISGPIPNLTIEHTTGFGGDNSIVWSPGSQAGQVIRNNMMAGAPLGPGGQWGNAWTDGTSLTGNLFVDKYGTSWVAPLPAGNLIAASFSAVVLSGGPAAATSISAYPGELALALDSPYKGKATDGKDPGADVASVLSAVAGVVKP